MPSRSPYIDDRAEEVPDAESERVPKRIKREYSRWL